jgi:hypothetical protein
MRNRRCDKADGAYVRRAGSSRFRACAALACVADDQPRGIAGPAAVRPRDCNQRHKREFPQVSNEETPTTEQPRALALAMRAGGRKKAAVKKAGRKAAPKKAAAKKKNGRKKGAYGKKAAPKKAGRKAAPKKKAAAKKGAGRKKAAGRKKGGGRKKAAAAAAPAAESMPSGGSDSPS